MNIEILVRVTKLPSSYLLKHKGLKSSRRLAHFFSENFEVYQWERKYVLLIALSKIVLFSFSGKKFYVVTFNGFDRLHWDSHKPIIHEIFFNLLNDDK